MPLVGQAGAIPSGGAGPPWDAAGRQVRSSSLETGARVSIPRSRKMSDVMSFQGWEKTSISSLFRGVTGLA